MNPQSGNSVKADVSQIASDHGKEQQHFWNLVNNIPGTVYRMVPGEYRFIEFTNNEIEVLTGYPVVHFTNRQLSYGSLVHEEDRQYVHNEIAICTTQKKTYELSYRITDQNGRIKTVYEKGRAVYDVTDPFFHFRFHATLVFANLLIILN